MRMPSEQLTERLTSLQICSEEQLRSCEPAVRRLCHDLPDFDTVWIDALAQCRVITPWQADQLLSDDPSVLRVESLLLTDGLGNRTWHAVSTIDGTSSAVTQICSSSDAQISVLHSGFDDLIERLDAVRRSAPPSVALPERVIRTDHGLFMISPFIGGWTVEDLLLRGGRLPWQCVAEIGVQLATGLDWLSTNQLIHGELLLRTIRITAAGKTVLVQPFLTGFLNPVISFSSELQLRQIECIAPERVGTGRRADVRSELYSFGCCLWQMLTSRPVYLSADPVTRLIKATERDIADVRTLTPDCPDWMARILNSLTRRSPELRPSDFRDVSQVWSRHTSTSVRHTKELVKRLPDRKQLKSKLRSASNSRRRSFATTAVTTVTMLLLFTGIGLYRGVLPMPLRVSGVTRRESVPMTQSAESTLAIQPPESLSQHERAESGHLKLPSPDAAGVIVLLSGESYEASDIHFPGVLYLESTAAVPATIHVPAGTSWQIHASQASLSGINVRPVKSADDTPRASAKASLIECTSNVLSLTRCRFDCGHAAVESCVHWMPGSDAARIVTVKDCVFDGATYGLWFSQPPVRCGLENVLFADTAASLRCDTDSRDKSPSLNFSASHVTSVAGQSFLDIVSASPDLAELRIQIRCGESVLCPQLSLVRTAWPEGISPEVARVEFLLPERGNPTIVSPSIHPVVYFDRSLGKLVQLPTAQVTSESLLMANPVFRSQPSPQSAVDVVQTSELLDFEGPKLTTEMPGIDVQRLAGLDTSHSIHQQTP